MLRKRGLSGPPGSEPKPEPAGSGIERRELLRLGGLMGLGAFSLTVSGRALAVERLKSLTSTRPKQIIVIDPGHGGVDPGCIGFSGTYEKDITFSAAGMIVQMLNESGRYSVVLTRQRDEFIPLAERVARARRAKGDLFLSVHADAIPNEHVRGASVFTLSAKASDATAAALAEHENSVDQIAGVPLEHRSAEVSSILFDLARRQTNNLSLGLAKELVQTLGTSVRMLENSHRSAGFAVLKAPDIPSALVEMGCLSNREEDRLLRTQPYREKVARGIVRSIDAYFTQIIRV